MHENPKHAEGVQEAYSTPRMLCELGFEQYSCSPLVVHENDRVGGTGAGNPSSGDDVDEAQANSDLLTTWMQRLQVLTVVVSRPDTSRTVLSLCHIHI